MAITVGGIQFNVVLNTTGVVQGAQTVTNNFNIIQKAANQTNAALGKLNSTVDSLASGVGALASAFAAGAAFSYLKEVTLLAARVENLQTVLNTVGRTAGLNTAQLGLLEDKVKALGITTQEARNSITLLAQSELKLENATKLARIAQDAAVIAGINSSEALGRLAIAVQRGDSRLLRNLGIVINLAQVYQDYAVSVGRTVNTLTPLEKRQLILNEVFKKGEVIAGTYEASLGDVNKQYTSLARFVEEAEVAIGQQFLPVFRQFIKIQTEFFRDTLPIYARFTSNLLAMGAAIAGIATVATAASVAVKALGAAFGWVTLVAVALGAVAFAIQDSMAATEQWRLELDKTAKASRELVQTTYDQVQAAEVVREIYSKPVYDRTAKDALRLKAALKALGSEYEKSAKIAEKTGKEAQFVATLPQKIHNATTAQEQLNQRINELAETLAKAERSRGDIDDKRGFDQLRAAIQGSIEDTGNLNRELEGFKKITATGLVKTAQDVERLTAEIISLNSVFQQAKRVKIDAEYQQLADIFEELPQVAAQAERQIKELNTARRKVFKDTNVIILDDFQDFLSKQDTLIGATAANIEKFVDLEAQKKQLDTADQLQKALSSISDTEENRTKIAETKAKFAAISAAIEANKTERLIELTRDLATAKEGLAKAIELTTLQLKEEAEAIEDLETQVVALEKGIDVDTVRAQKRFQKETRSTTLALEEQNKIMKEAREAQKAAADAGDTELVSRFQKIIEATEQAQQQTLEKQRLVERKFVAESFKERKEAIDRLREEEERTIERIAELRELAAARTFEQVKKISDAQKKERKEVDEFIRELQSQKDDPTGQTEKFLTLVNNFREKIEKARPDQLNLIRKLFPDAQRKLLKEINKDLDAIDRRFRRFSEDREQRIGDINRRAAEAFKEATLSGAGESTAAEAAERQRQRELEDLRLEQAEIEEAKAGADKARVELSKQQRAQAGGLNKLTDTSVLGGLFTLRKQQLDAEKRAGLDEEAIRTRLVELRDQEIARNEKILEDNQKLLGFYQDQLKIVNDLVRASEQATGLRFGDTGPGAVRLRDPEKKAATPFTEDEKLRARAKEISENFNTGTKEFRQAIQEARKAGEPAKGILIGASGRGDPEALKRQIVAEGGLAYTARNRPQFAADTTAPQGAMDPRDAAMLAVLDAARKFSGNGVPLEAQVNINDLALATAEKDGESIKRLENRIDEQAKAWDRQLKSRGLKK